MAEEVPTTPQTEPKKRYAILAHDDDYSGVHPDGARFFDGVAFTDDPKLAEHYDGLGFQVQVAQGTRPVRLCDAAKAAQAKEKGK